MMALLDSTSGSQFPGLRSRATLISNEPSGANSMSSRFSWPVGVMVPSLS